MQSAAATDRVQSSGMQTRGCQEEHATSGVREQGGGVPSCSSTEGSMMRWHSQRRTRGALLRSSVACIPSPWSLSLRLPCLPRALVSCLCFCRFARCGPSSNRAAGGMTHRHGAARAKRTKQRRSDEEGMGTMQEWWTDRLWDMHALTAPWLPKQAKA